MPALQTFSTNRKHESVIKKELHTYAWAGSYLLDSQVGRRTPRQGMSEPDICRGDKNNNGNAEQTMVACLYIQDSISG